MNDLTQNFILAKQTFPCQKEVGIELLFVFSNEKQARSYYQHIYHPEHADELVEVHGEDNGFICGFLATFDFEIEHLKSIVECYTQIAKKYDGQPHKFRFHKKANQLRHLNQQ
jgi:hypothetical protein